jgi:hypothetical protein
VNGILRRPFIGQEFTDPEGHCAAIKDHDHETYILQASDAM